MAANGDTNSTEPKKYFCAAFTQEQYETVEALFVHYDWDFGNALQEGADHFGTINNDTEGDSAESVQFIFPQPGADECQHCLASPCVTDERHRQFWWEDHPHQPHSRNPKKRKAHYKKFWTMLLHRGVFQDERYKQRKSIAMGRDPRFRKYVYHRRDIMPNCVLKCVRTWLPNLPGVSYLGHMWE